MSELVFYDITCNSSKSKAWSANTWIVRYAFNFKGLKYRTEWVELCDIEVRCKAIGASATRLKSDGSPEYTLPVIHNSTTNTVVSDSLAIVAYLDNAYPDTPRLLPPGKTGLYSAFRETVDDSITFKAYRLNVHRVYLFLNPCNETHYRGSREQWFGMKLEEVAPPGSEVEMKVWKEVENGFKKVATWYDIEKDQDGGSGLFIEGGQTPGYADFLLAARMMWIEITLGDTEAWARIKNLDGGRWARFLEQFNQYNVVL
ncbi:hypothetical protein BXZ70DRAFT_601944 [Cristinia sonorae]|uniref:GST N-terminal domain-containing protein n=1 Tax=Cristinia sonorae TaxID=1940300 RepID=A0A8K0UUF0_9AGAR|nr:hypothetical protein BXZ70DRAFT_601944 [Cristinia sonorae]